GKLDIARTRRAPANQPGDIVAGPLLLAVPGVCLEEKLKHPAEAWKQAGNKVRFALIDGVHATDVRERAANHDVAAILQGEPIHEAARLLAQAVNQAGKLVVGRVQEAGVQRAVVEEPRHADPARSV